MSALPPDFIERIQNDAFYPEKLLEALETQAPTSVRIHPRRANSLHLAKSVAWNNEGFYLAQRPSFTYDPLFHAGAYYPQEAGSMYLRQALEALSLPENPVVLDLSAAPGGKSTLIASFLDQKGLLIANEINRSRAYILAENLSKWGYSNTFVCNHKPEELKALSAKIDVLLVDAPCSGEGMFRKDLAARNEWTTAAAAHCALRQEQILEDTWPLLKENGYLIYSTCTFNPEENEILLQRLVAEDFKAVSMKLPHFEGMQADRFEMGHYFFPGQTESEGFYIAVFQKTGGNSNQRKKEKDKGKSKTAQTIKTTALTTELPLQQNLPHTFWTESDQLQATTPFAFEFYQQISSLHWLKKGLHVAQRFKKSWAPAYDIVYSLDLKWDLPFLDVENEQALQILHGESQTFSAEAGHYFVRYQGQNIAMVKQLGQRFNNLHPTEWRIRHLPKK